MSRLSMIVRVNVVLNRTVVNRLTDVSKTCAVVLLRTTFTRTIMLNLLMKLKKVAKFVQANLPMSIPLTHAHIVWQLSEN